MSGSDADLQMLRSLLCGIHKTLLLEANASPGGSNNIIERVRSLAEQGKKKRQETLAAVQLEEMIWQFRSRQILPTAETSTKQIHVASPTGAERALTLTEREQALALAEREQALALVAALLGSSLGFFIFFSGREKVTAIP